MTGRVLLLCAMLSAGLFGPAEARERHGRFESRGEEPAQQDEERRSENRRDRDEDRDERQDHQNRKGRSGERRGGERGEAAREAQARNGGGRVLSVEPEDGGWRVKVLKNGEVRTHHVEGR